MNQARMLLIVLSSLPGLGAAPATECEAALTAAVARLRLHPSGELRARFDELLRAFAHTPENAVCLGLAASDAAAIAQWQGNLREAERLASQAVATLEKVALRDLLVGRPLQILAGVYIAQGQIDRARKLLTRIDSTIPLTPVDAAMLAGARAAILDREGRLAEAERQYREAIVQWEKAGKKTSLNVVPEMENLAVLYLKQKRRKEAEPLLRSALTIADTAAAESDPGLLVAVLTNLGIFEIGERQWGGAQVALDRAMATARRSEIPPDVRRRLYEAYAAVLRHSGRKQEARNIAAEAKAIIPSETSSQLVSFRELHGH